jgi:hypothetical protein
MILNSDIMLFVFKFLKYIPVHHINIKIKDINHFKVLRTSYKARLFIKLLMPEIPKAHLTISSFETRHF